MRQFQVVLVVLAILISGCSSETSTEDHIRAVISMIEKAAEERSMSGVSQHLSVNYKDKYHWNRRAAVRSLLGYFHQHRSIHLLTRITSVEIDTGEQAANAVVYVAMAGVPVESIDALVTVKANLYRFDIRLLEEQGQWRVINTEWREASVADFG